MGIGNTTPSAALTTALGVPSTPPGRSPDELPRNTAAGQKALDINAFNPHDGLDLFSKAGGGNRRFHIPRGVPDFRRLTLPPRLYARIPPIRGTGPLRRPVPLGLDPLPDWGMRMGESAGAALAIPIIESARRLSFGNGNLC